MSFVLRIISPLLCFISIQNSTDRVAIDRNWAEIHKICKSIDIPETVFNKTEILHVKQRNILSLLALYVILSLFLFCSFYLRFLFLKELARTPEYSVDFSFIVTDEVMAFLHSPTLSVTLQKGGYAFSLYCVPFLKCIIHSISVSSVYSSKDHQKRIGHHQRSVLCNLQCRILHSRHRDPERHRRIK